MKPKKKTSRAKLMDKLEKLVKEHVKKRDNYTCQKCDKVVEGSNCQASHVIPVSFSKRMSFDPLNLKVLCYHCHLNVWHKNPLDAAEWFKNKFPDRMKYLEELKKQPPTPLKEYELEEMIKKFDFSQ